MVTIIFFVVMLAVIIIGPRKGINCGVLGLAAAFVCGCLFLGYDSTGIIQLFPTRLFFQIMNAALFYGFANSNGTMEKIAKQVTYLFRNNVKLMPIVLLLITVLINALGGGMATSIIMSPIAFMVAKQLGFDPLLASMACWAGIFMDSAPWTADFAFFSSWLGSYSTYEAGYKVMINEWWMQAIVFCLAFIVVYIWKKGYKIGEDKTLIIEKPEAFDGKQKLTLATIVIIIALVVIPALWDVIAPCAVSTWMVTYVTIQPMCSIGSVILAFAKVADVKEVVKERVPWDTIIMVCGVSTLMGMCEDLGIIDVCTNLLSKVPSGIILPLICTICAFLSFFVAGMSVCSLLYPLNAALSAASGASIVAVLQTIDLGLNISSFSPFSMGGSLAMSGAGPEVDKDKLISDQMKVAVIQSIFMVLLSFIGFTKLAS